jgi:hypothetical protein
MQLLRSLLPALERHAGTWVTEIHLPDRGDLADYRAAPDTGLVRRYRRGLPNALSRLLECTVLARRFDGDSPLLVLGDLPLRCAAPQTVFVQTPHLCPPTRFKWSLDGFKFAISRFVFRLNAQRASAFIVQTQVMKQMLAASYPKIANKLHVIAQPVPSWLLNSPARRDQPRALSGTKLKLIYPAAMYPHKNHSLLSQIPSNSAPEWPVEQLMLTLPSDKNPAPEISWIRCVGFLAPQEMIQAYTSVDGLLFLSTAESYGFPLLEAMYMGLPIVCPDRPYARELCANGAIYFDPESVDSLHRAVETLKSRLAEGWWPDWSKQLASIPKDWETVASALIDIALAHTGEAPRAPF